MKNSEETRDLEHARGNRKDCCDRKPSSEAVKKKQKEVLKH